MAARTRWSSGLGRATRRRSELQSKRSCTLLLDCCIIDSASKCTGERLSSQVLSEQASALDAFARLLRANSAATRTMNARLVADHGLTINAYEALLLLYRAEDQRMRRV